MPTIAVETPLQDDVLALLAESDAYSEALYPPEARYPVDADALAATNVRFLVARLHDRAVGCVALLLRGGGQGEIKRMIVSGAARGQGVGRLLLDAVEEAARREGVDAILLETGPGNDAALRLYRTAGYRDRGPFGDYRPGPFSLFMEKRLAT